MTEPYRWLEDLIRTQRKPKPGFKPRTALPSIFLARSPNANGFTSVSTQLWNTERYSPPFQRGGRYFFSKNDGLQNQSVLYTLERLTAEPKVLLDPNTLSTDGTVALSGYSVSEDGKRLAYGLAASGSDWQEWKVRERPDRPGTSRIT